MKILRAFFALAVFASAAILSSFAAFAETTLIHSILLTDNNGEYITNFNYDPSAPQDAYNIILPAETQKINISVSAGADAKLKVYPVHSSPVTGSCNFSLTIGSNGSAVCIIDAIDDDLGEYQSVELNFILTDPVVPDDPDAPEDLDDPEDTDEPDNAGDPVGGEDDNAAGDDETEDQDQDRQEDAEEYPEEGEDDCICHQKFLIFRPGIPAATDSFLPETLDAAPYILPPGHMYVPLRFIAEKMGAAVNWDASQRRVDIFSSTGVITLFLDSVIPGMGVGAQIVNGRTFVPLRYVAENLGAQVEWLSDISAVCIRY